MMNPQEMKILLISINMSKKMLHFLVKMRKNQNCGLDKYLGELTKKHTKTRSTKTRKYPRNAALYAADFYIVKSTAGYRATTREV